MKIGIVIGAFNREGGLERVAVESARGLLERGHRVTVVTLVADPASIPPCVETIELKGISSPIWMRAATFPILATRAIADLNLDVIYSFGCSVFAPSVVRLPGAHRSWWELANREWPATTIDGIRRRMNPHHRITLFSERIVLGRKLPLRVLAAGDWVKTELERYYPGNRVFILPDGVNLDEFQFDLELRLKQRAEWGIDDSSPLLFLVVTELRRKGVDSLLEAFKIVKQEIPEAALVIGGKAPKADLKAVVAHHGLKREVKVVGKIQDIRAAYSAADVLVFPTRFDPWGLPVIEALACGTPVAVSVRAGAAIAVKDGYNGALISDPASPREIAAATRKALYCEPSRAEVRETASEYGWAKVISRLEQHLLEAVAEKD